MCWLGGEGCPAVRVCGVQIKAELVLQCPCPLAGPFLCLQCVPPISYLQLVPVDVASKLLGGGRVGSVMSERAEPT